MRRLHSEIEGRGYGQWPGMTLSLIITGILKPPSLTTCASKAYLILVSSNFLPRAMHKSLNALCVAEIYTASTWLVPDMCR